MTAVAILFNVKANLSCRLKYLEIGLNNPVSVCVCVGRCVCVCVWCGVGVVCVFVLCSIAKAATGAISCQIQGKVEMKLWREAKLLIPEIGEQPPKAINLLERDRERERVNA